MRRYKLIVGRCTHVQEVQVAQGTEKLSIRLDERIRAFVAAVESSPLASRKRRNSPTGNPVRSAKRRTSIRCGTAIVRSQPGHGHFYEVAVEYAKGNYAPTADSIATDPFGMFGFLISKKYSKALLAQKNLRVELQEVAALKQQGFIPSTPNVRFSYLISHFLRTKDRRAKLLTYSD